jgi:hypothetical protein
LLEGHSWTQSGRPGNFIEANPHLDSAKTLDCLVRALESEDKFEFGELYKLGYEQFNLGIDVLKEWRLDRY